MAHTLTGVGHRKKMIETEQLLRQGDTSNTYRGSFHFVVFTGLNSLVGVMLLLKCNFTRVIILH